MIKKFILKVDNVFLAKILQKIHSKFAIAAAQKKFESGFDYKIVSYYKKNERCEISSLCDLYGSDKGELTSGPHPYPEPSHTYADFYYQIFKHCRYSVKNVFECGIGDNHLGLPLIEEFSGKPGASLRVWRDFFPMRKSMVLILIFMFYLKKIE